MALQALIDVVNDRGQGRGLATSAGAGDENQAAGTHRQFLENVRQTQLVDGQRFAGMARNTAPTASLCHIRLPRKATDVEII